MLRRLRAAAVVRRNARYPSLKELAPFPVEMTGIAGFSGLCDGRRDIGGENASGRGRWSGRSLRGWRSLAGWWLGRRLGRRSRRARWICGWRSVNTPWRVLGHVDVVCRSAQRRRRGLE
jgi:hypothetical protein